MIRQITPEAVKAKLDAGEPVYLLDVRQPEEYAICRLPGSRLIPLGELPYRAAEVEPPAGAAVVVYCHHGIRSLSGAAILQQAAGLSEVYSLSGGIDAWSQRIDPAVPRY
ncbi:MAG TPA: rhodanese-like domain-containing protein [Fimbriiglobus sp.]|nr:rhodanese-like domain-containing protein [Fimbriiglobus sp.]